MLPLPGLLPVFGKTIVLNSMVPAWPLASRPRFPQPTNSGAKTSLIAAGYQQQSRRFNAKRSHVQDGARLIADQDHQPDVRASTTLPPNLTLALLTSI